MKKRDILAQLEAIANELGLRVNVDEMGVTYDHIIEELLKQILAAVSGKELDNVPDEVTELARKLRDLEKEVDKLKKRPATPQPEPQPWPWRIPDRQPYVPRRPYQTYD